MFGISPFILIILPLIFQIIFGRKKVTKNIKLSFPIVCFISILLQIIFSYLSFKTFAYNFKMNFNGKVHCGMPLLGMAFIEVFFLGGLLAIILIQYLARKTHKNLE
jgi:uncharacterized protein with PQ loop repeat